MKRYELTKEQWERIKELLPAEQTGKRGRPQKINRSMLNGMVWIARSGAQWRELPEAPKLGFIADFEETAAKVSSREANDLPVKSPAEI